jgi:hypothetical protein
MAASWNFDSYEMRGSRSSLGGDRDRAVGRILGRRGEPTIRSPHPR